MPKLRTGSARKRLKKATEKRSKKTKAKEVASPTDARARSKRPVETARLAERRFKQTMKRRMPEL